MGCGGSKHVKKDKSIPTITSTKLSKIDELFIPAREALTALNSLIQDFHSSEKHLKHLTSTNILDNSTISDSLKSFLIFLIASTDHNFEYFELKFLENSPYLTIEKSKLDSKQKQIFEAWENFAETVENTEKKLLELDINYKIIVEDLPKIDLASKDVCNSSGLGLGDAASVMKATIRNFKAVRKGSEVIGRYLEILRKIKSVFVAIRGEYESEGLEEVFRIGIEIKGCGVKSIRDVVVKYWNERANLKMNGDGKGEIVRKRNTNK